MNELFASIVRNIYIFASKITAARQGRRGQLISIPATAIALVDLELAKSESKMKKTRAMETIRNEKRGTLTSGAGRRAMTTLGEISRSKAIGRSHSTKSSYLQSTRLPSVEG